MLLCACCAPCSVGAVLHFRQEYDITIWYYGSNLDTQSEYQRRLDALEKLAHHFNLKVITHPYNHAEFLNAIKGHENQPEGGSRCIICFTQRLNTAAQYAELNSFDVFATTLTASPHKCAKTINQIGEQAQSTITYIPSDLKHYHNESVKFCKEHSIYRQRYCGCRK